MNKAIRPKFFATANQSVNGWKKNHDKKKKLLVGFYKTVSGKKSINWPESVNKALCFSWIDGVQKSIDEESYFIRFTPLKTKSI